MWTVFGTAIMTIVFIYFRPNLLRSAIIRQTTRTAQARAINLAVDEQARLASKIRASALDAYDSINKAARTAGKDDSFAHQAGVLQALSATAAPARELSVHDQRELQFETMPFNKVPLIEGRLAVAEYAVWKFFPSQADEALFAPTLRRFRAEVYDDVNVSSDVTYGLLYSMKYEWQRWLSNHRH